jgi:hypothetical protein
VVVSQESLALNDEKPAEAANQLPSAQKDMGRRGSTGRGTRSQTVDNWGWRICQEARMTSRISGRPADRDPHRRPNTLLRIDGDDVIVATGRSPSGQAVPIDCERYLADHPSAG